jgi:serine/threonine protein phosphatase PrpC
MENFIYHNLTKKNFSLIKNIINSIDKDLSKENFDSKSSGSTLLLLLHISKFIICVKIGDSRCILIKKNTPSENNNNSNNINNFNFENLSFDHKPNNQEEKKRIIENGGIVRQSLNYNGLYEGCYRIYMKEKNYPGLAISRTIGDFDSKLIGNISEPDIKSYFIDTNYKLAILASDGLWDAFNEEDIIYFSNQFFKKDNIENFSEEIGIESVKRWNDYSIERDDVTVVTVLLNPF